MAQSRGVIEGEFAGLLPRLGWPGRRVTDLQVATLDVDRGTHQLAVAVSEPSVAAMPPEVVTPLSSALRSLASLLAAGHESIDELSSGSARLEHEVADLADSVRSRAGASLSPWFGPAVLITRGCRRATQGLVEVHRLADGPDAPPAPVVQGAASLAAAAPGPPPKPRFAGVRLHPTTALGLQAVLAVGAAMLVAALLGMERSAAVFWSAFVVIAGSTGESLRRVWLRTAGTLTGTLAGVTLAMVIDDAIGASVAAAAAALFFVLFYAPVSYNIMVFWLTLAVAVVLAQLGSSTGDLLVDRPLAALIGGAVASLVVITVFPTRAGDRYRQSLAGLLDATAASTTQAVDVALGHGDRGAAQVAAVKTEASHRKVEQTVPSVVFESSPFAQARSPLTSVSTRTGAMMAAHGAVSETATDEGLAVGADAVPIVRVLRDRIVENLEGLAGLVRGTGGVVRPSFDGVVGDAALQASAASTHEERSLLWALGNLHTTVVDLAAEVGGSGTPAFHPSARTASEEL